MRGRKPAFVKNKAGFVNAVPLGKQASEAIRDYASALKTKSAQRIEKEGFQLLNKLKNQTLRYAGGELRHVQLPSAARTAINLALPVMTKTAEKFLNSDGVRTANPSSTELALSRVAPLGFGQSSRQRSVEVQIGSKSKMPKGGGVREVEVPIYQSKYVERDGSWDDAEVSSVMETGFNTRTTRFFEEGAGCIPEQHLRRLLSPQFRQYPDACSTLHSGSALDTYLDHEEQNQRFTMYSPYQVKSEITATNLNPSFAARVTFNMVKLTHVADNPQVMVDLMDSQFDSLPSVFKLMNSSLQTQQPVKLDKYFQGGGAVHKSLGDTNNSHHSAIDMQTVAGKSVLDGNDNFFTVFDKKTFTLQPGELATLDVTNIQNTNFLDRGQLTTYTSEQMCASGYMGVMIEVEGVRGSVYNADWDGTNVIDREWKYGKLPATVAIDHSLKMVNYWKNTPWYGGVEPANNPSTFTGNNALYQRIYQRDFAQPTISIPAYCLPSDIVAGEEALVGTAANSSKVIVPTTTSRQTVAVGTPTQSIVGISDVASNVTNLVID